MGFTRAVLVAVLLLVLVVIVMAPLFRRPGGSRVVAALGVFALGCVWLMVNSPVEGETLFVLARERGITEADIPSGVAFLLALLILVIPRRRAREYDRR